MAASLRDALELSVRNLLLISGANFGEGGGAVAADTLFGQRIARLPCITSPGGAFRSAGNGPAAPGFGHQYRDADDGAAKDRRVPMRVLLIDDDALVRQTLADSLAEESIEVDGLADAEDALVLLSAGQVPDVLVTDIDLGAGLSGLDLASIAHERHPAVEVVLISGTSGAPGQPLPGRHERFLRKPFAPATLAQAIRGARRRRRRTGPPPSRQNVQGRSRRKQDRREPAPHTRSPSPASRCSTGYLGAALLT